jgi:hypothetical protein
VSVVLPPVQKPKFPLIVAAVIGAVVVSVTVLVEGQSPLVAVTV